jgi:hypothetical protein
MQLHSTHAGHKLIIAILLLALVVVPFAIQRHSVATFDTQSLMAGGAVIGNSAFENQNADAPRTNHIGQAAGTAGSNFVGAMAQ